MSTLEVPFDRETGEMVPDLRWFWDESKLRWRDNYEFTSTLTYESFLRSDHAVRIVFRGDDGKEYHMFLKELHDILVGGGFDGNKVSGVWTFCKRGQNFGIRLVRRA